jgi:chemotaxis protein CheY-P-specific phosphatase CheC
MQRKSGAARNTSSMRYTLDPSVSIDRMENTLTRDQTRRMIQSFRDIGWGELADMLEERLGTRVQVPVEIVEHILRVSGAPR